MNRTLSLMMSAISQRFNCLQPMYPSLKPSISFKKSQPIATHHQFNNQRIKQGKLASSLSNLHNASYSFSSLPSKPSSPKGKGGWKTNGTPEFIVGFTILSLVGIDQFLQSKQRKNRQDVVDQLRLAVHVDTLEEKNNETVNGWSGGGARSASSSLLGEKVALFSCVVRRIPKLFDGNKSLMNVHIGDKVDILEENVGPDRMYHLCRLKRECEGGIGHADNDDEDKHKNSADEDNHYFNVGWFPISCLEKE